MSAQLLRSHDPDDAWQLAFRFLLRHCRTPDDRPLPEHVGLLLMVGVWAGARFAALDAAFGLALCQAGNRPGEKPYTSLQRGFLEEFGEALTLDLERLLEIQGFTGTELRLDCPAPEPSMGEQDVRAALDAIERLLRGEDPGGHGGTS